MSIIRSPRSGKFTVINNCVFADNHLSYPAIGLLCYLLSRPDNWTVQVDFLAARTNGTAKKSSKEVVYDLLNELISAGYIERKKLSTGKTTYTVFDNPQTKPNQEKPNQEKPNQEKPNQDFPDALINTESLTKTEKENKDGEAGVNQVDDVADNPSSDGLMFADWQPEDLPMFQQQLRRAMLPNWESEQVQTALVEFVSYWQTRSETNSNSGWTHKFLQNLMRLKAQGRMSVKAADPAHKRFGQHGQQTMPVATRTRGLKPLGKVQ